MKETASRVEASVHRFNLGASIGRINKRVFDILASGLGLLFLGPYFILVSRRIRHESPGGAFYRGSRLGMHGKIFRILKFRTMYERPESYQGSLITAEDDDRITPLGRRLRESKVNELPQLWNVFKGEMSIVGPRPEDPEVAKTWSREVFREILSVRPGITSPASVLYRNEEKLLQSRNVMDEYLRNILPDKQRLDLLYVRTRSFISDMDILLMTLLSLFPMGSGSAVAERSLFSGALTNLYRRYITWFIADTLTAFVASGIVGGLWRLGEPLKLGWGNAIGLAAGIALIFSIINTILGLGRVSWKKASSSQVFDLAFSIVLSIILIFAANWFWPGGKLIPPGMVVIIGLMALLGFIATRYRQRLLTGLAMRWLRLRRQERSIGERVLIVGAGDCGQLADWLLQKSNLKTGFSVVGLVDDNPYLHDMQVNGHPVLGSTRDLPAIIQKHNIGIILYAITSIVPGEQERILSLCRSLPVRLVIIPDLLEILQNALLPGMQNSPDEEQDQP